LEFKGLRSIMHFEVEYLKYVALGLVLGFVTFWALLLRWSRTDWRSTGKANRGLWIMVILAMAVPVKSYFTDGEMSPLVEGGRVTYAYVFFLLGYLLGYVNHRILFKAP
jgi:ABC-type amino acid transport system permease subunit